METKILISIAIAIFIIGIVTGTMSKGGIIAASILGVLIAFTMMLNKALDNLDKKEQTNSH